MRKAWPYPTPSPHARRPCPTLQPEDLIVDSAVLLVREAGLLDAKALVVSDVEVLVEAADEVLVSLAGFGCGRPWLVPAALLGLPAQPPSACACMHVSDGWIDS